MVVSILLAGCGGQQHTPAEEQPTSTQGSVTGIVVDQTVRPVEGVLVTLGGSLQTSTDSLGAFRFPAVDVGTYVVLASKEEFLATQGTVSVLAGKVHEMRLQLLAEARSDPYHNTVDFRGFAQASAGLLTPLLHQAIEQLGATACDCAFQVEPAAGLTNIVLEVTWEDSVSDPTGPTEFIWQVAAVDASNETTATGQGQSPIRRELGRLDFPAQSFDFSDSATYEVRVYPDATWPAVSQEYAAYVSLWYRGRPPSGWSVIGD